MWFLWESHCFVWYIISPLFFSHYFSQEITLGRDSRFSFPPLPLGQGGPEKKGRDYFNTKTIQHGPLCTAHFQWVHVSQTIPSQRKYSVYYLVLCPTNHVNIYIKWKGFFYICFIKLSSVYTLVYIKIKKYPKWGWPPLPNALAPFAQAIGQRGSLWEQIYLVYN